MRGLIVLVSLAGAALAACAREPSFAERADASLVRAREWLVARQAPDGAWRSETYGALKDGLALTPSVAKSLLFLPGDARSAAAAERGLEILVRAVREDGTIDAGPYGLGFPVYTASLSVLALARGARPDDARARDAWLAFLSRQQLNEKLGWGTGDAAFGGFGYALEPLVKPAPGSEHAWDADLSSTLFALGALRAAGVPVADKRIVKALRFVERCQNLPLDGASPEPELDDGGFFFTPTNEIQNKAGGKRIDRSGRVRYASYGSLTADGLRALLRAGLAPDHPRVRAARRWLELHFDARANPGLYDSARESERAGSRFYWSWSVAHALTELGVDELATPRGGIDWRAELGEALMLAQAADGAWRNHSTLVKEDDPLVATPFALAALALCRWRLHAAPR